MKTLLHSMITAMVDDPEHVIIKQKDGVQTCILEVYVHKNDVGKIIGKRGNHADAIRTFLDACGGKDKKKYILEIME